MIEHLSLISSNATKFGYSSLSCSPVNLITNSRLVNPFAPYSVVCPIEWIMPVASSELLIIFHLQ